MSAIWYSVFRLPYGEPTPWVYAIYWTGQTWPRVTRPEFASRTTAECAAFDQLVLLAAYPGFTSNTIALEKAAASQFLRDVRERDGLIN